PPDCTRGGTAVVTTARHRRSRPAEIPTPYPARVPHLRRRPWLGRHHAQTADRAPEFTTRSHRSHQHTGDGVILSNYDPVRWPTTVSTRVTPAGRADNDARPASPPAGQSRPEKTDHAGHGSAVPRVRAARVDLRRQTRSTSSPLDRTADNHVADK